MQYPIIDRITDAYINNGWTGLNINFNQGGVYDSDGGFSSANNRIRTYYTKIETLGTIINNNQNDIKCRSLHFYDLNRTYLGYISVNAPLPVNINNYTRPTNTVFCVIVLIFPNNAPITPSDVFITNNGKFIDNVSHRLKSPLPHYFPHSVIDALQRAAAGTQTADDTEVLRHYLTPLGIGGI